MAISSEDARKVNEKEVEFKWLKGGFKRAWVHNNIKGEDLTLEKKVRSYECHGIV